MDFKFAKDRYDYELERKEQLTAALTLPMTALSILGGALIAMARSFSYEDRLLTALFGSLIVLDAVAFTVCLTYLGRAYHRQKYIYLPLLKELDEWEEEYRQFMSYVESTGGHAPGTEHTILERIIDAADRNTRNNDIRSGLLHWARVALFMVLVMTALAGIPYVADQVRFAMPRSEPTTPQPQPQNTTPQPPPAPPNREIREGDPGPRRP